MIATVEESALLQRKYEKYLDMEVINEDFDITFRKVIEALDALSHEHQWVREKFLLIQFTIAIRK